MRFAMLAFGLLMFAGHAAAQPAAWSTDPSASSLRFTVRVEKAAARGEFSRFDVAGRFDPDSPAGSLIDVAIDVASVTMGSDEIDTAIRGADWLDAQRHPVARFHATDVRAEGGDRFVASGIVTLKGIVRPIEVPFRWKRAGADRATIEGEIRVDRRAFGIGGGEWAATDVLAAEVAIAFDVRLVRKPV